MCARCADLFHERRDLVAVVFRHPDIREDDVRRSGPDLLDRLAPVAGRNDGDVFVGERQLDDAPNRQAVVREQQCWHLVTVS